jgi:superfamily I DNA/RNA helicase
VAFVRPGDWRPRGIADLEPAAWAALRHDGSTSVVAGPGAGKTEFLAQRAVYLLETGLCPPPFRVLAISFKSDAAKNLADRVRLRCPAELAQRFTSLTFDAFTKGLVDRFQAALPETWRPSRPYEIAFPSRQQLEGFLTGARLATPRPWQAAIAAMGGFTFESHRVGPYRLPHPRQPPTTPDEFAVQRWWDKALAAQPRSALTFVTLNRLAELVLRAAPDVKRALQLTYPFIFVDEFQDTTYAQYDFLLSAFRGAGLRVTAVGDDKQRIMTWAGARPDAFQRLEADFQAARIPLLFNFRSSADLVQIQQVVARALDPNAAAAVAQAPRQVDGDVAQVWKSPDKDREAQYLAAWLRADMDARGRTPRDYAILVKQKSDEVEADLEGAFQTQGLRLRNESHALGKTTLQDLLADEFVRIAIAIFRLGAVQRAPHAWQSATRAILELRAVAPDDELAEARVEATFTTFIQGLRRDMAQTAPSRASAITFAEQVVDFINLDAVRRSYVHYAVGDLLDIMVDGFLRHLVGSVEGAPSWSDGLDVFEGLDQIPLMTVHKSKGLEYDTIVFVGLDDRAWWAHNPGDLEGLATFFVALSRAKQRAIFAFCQQRGNRVKVAELFKLLADAGVREIDI